MILKQNINSCFKIKVKVRVKVNLNIRVNVSFKVKVRAEITEIEAPCRGSLLINSCKICLSFRWLGLIF